MVRGGQLTSRAVAFSEDGHYLLVPMGSTTRLYSTATAQFVSQIRGHVSAVTQVVAEHAATSQLLTSSADGSIKRWTLPQGDLVSSSTVGYPIEHMVLLPDKDVVLLSLHFREGQVGRIVRYSLKSGQILPGPAFKTCVSGVPLVPSPSGAFVGTFENHVMNVWRASAEHIKAAPFFHTKEFQCMCMDPEDKILAAGDASGRILIWHNFGTYIDAKAAGKAVEPPECSTLHWHSQPVGCLAFTADSTYLLSGGKEGVLVIWHLVSGERNYLPRLGSGLRAIAACPSDPSLFCLSQEDNTIRLFNLSSMQVVRSIHGVRPPPRGVNALQLNTCTKMHPVSHHLVMSGTNASLQFFDPLQDRHVSKLQVVSRNNILTDWLKPGSAPLDPWVSHVSFSSDGSVMVTIDVRPDASSRATAIEGLRFWDEVNGGVHANQAAPYSLNTYVDQPHSEGTSSMSYHPNEDSVVTTGRQAGFKVWHRPAAHRSGGQATKKCWSCSCVGSYRQLPFFSSTFSSDGTIIALGSSSSVVLWEYPSVTWLGTLTCPGRVSHKSFFYSVAMPGNGLFLVGASQGCDEPKVVVWNVETLMPVWVLSLYTCGLSPHPTLDAFAVAIPAGQKPDQDSSLPISMVLVFEAHSSRPKRVVRVPDCLFPWVAFAPSHGLQSSDEDIPSFGFNPGALVVLSERRSIHWAVGRGMQVPDLSGARQGDVKPLQEASVSKLVALFGDSSVSGTADMDEAMDVAVSDTRAELQRVAKLLDMPSHLLPPASTLCERALELLLLPQTDGDDV